MATYGYIRVSTVEQIDGSSLAEQTRRIEGLAMMEGHELAQVFSDGGVSGSVPLAERPEGYKLMAALKPGDLVIVAKMDRMFRDAADALAVAKRFKDQGVDLVLADMGPQPITGNGAGKLFFGVLAMVAEFERERIAERLNEGRKAKKASGGFTGGSRPFGYRVIGEGKEAHLSPIAREQEAIKLMVELHKEGNSLRKIAHQVKETYWFDMSAMKVKRVLDREDAM